MTQLHLHRWSNQFAAKNTIKTVRRTILGRIASGECLVVYDANVPGLDSAIQLRIRTDGRKTKCDFQFPFRQIHRHNNRVAGAEYLDPSAPRDLVPALFYRPDLSKPISINDGIVTDWIFVSFADAPDGLFNPIRGRSKQTFIPAITIFFLVPHIFPFVCCYYAT